MTINGLDISMYQESSSLINWPALSHDPRQFKFIWIKCAEGELAPTDAGAYPVKIFQRQVVGAVGAGLKAGPYHFYYYHVSLGNGSYYPLSPYVQAAAFCAAAQDYEGELPPMVDLEDPYLYNPVRLFDFHDTPTANNALAWARKVCNHVRQYVEEVARLFGRKPVIYTGTWWWNPWAFLAQSYTEEMKWAKDYDFYLADYAHEKPDTCLGAGRVIAHQYTSTPSPVIAGIPNGGHVDCARWLLSDTEYAIWGGGEKKLSDAEKLAKLWTAHPELH